MSTIDHKVDAEQSRTSQELILGLTVGEEILQFNKECERLTGYKRDEVLHKKLSDILLPKESIEFWKTLLTSIRQTMWVDDFAFAIKTKHDQIYMISWTGFLIKDEKGSIKDICLFGKPLKTEEMHNQSVDTLVVPSAHYKDVNIQLLVYEPMPQLQNGELSMKQKTKEILFAVEKEIETKPINNNLLPKYDEVIRPLGKLEKKDRLSEKNHTSQTNHIPLIEKRYGPFKRKQKDKNLKKILFAEQPEKNTEITFFSNSLGLKRQNRALDARTQQMDIRVSKLSACETPLMNEGKMLNARVEEFWKRQKPMKPKDVIRERAPGMNQRIIFATPEQTKSKEPATPEYHENLDEIPRSAAIIQRGVLKQINNSFVTLLGYSKNEVVEKSFFDFIALDGLADLEKYYLDRLKDESVTTYKTVFSTKDNNKIPVEVTIKQTMYNGEKAEIAIITCLETPEPRVLHEPAPKKSI